MACIEPTSFRHRSAARSCVKMLLKIWSVLFVKKTDRVKKFVVDAARADAPVGKTKRLPAFLDTWIVGTTARVAHSNV